MFSINDLFGLVSDISSEKHDTADNLLTYLAYLPSDNFDRVLCYKMMLNREDITEGRLNYTPPQAAVIKKRFKVIKVNNRAYRISTIKNPTAKDLEEFSYIDPCFSLLWPLKYYLIDHPWLLKEYRGCVPFGRPVKTYYNANRNKCGEDYEIKSTPDLKDHIDLQWWTNHLADNTGMPSIAVNSVMHLEGKKILEGLSSDTPEDSEI
jgi:hypothetical protein